MFQKFLRKLTGWFKPGPGKPAPPPAREAAPPPQRKQPAPPKAWDRKQFQVPQAEGKTRFHDLDLPDPIMHAIADLGFEYCTPIQAEILPTTLEGRDATGKAQTGTGKTAAFLITIFTHILKNPLKDRPAGTPRALILAPTRELVLQIQKDATELGKHTRCKSVAIFGGMEYQKQMRILDGPVDIVAATPGRLLDFRRSGKLHLSKVEILVIDEADRMLDMGFIPDVRRIVESTPPKAKRQTMFFSATITTDVKRLAAQWTKDATFVDISSEHVAVDTIDQVIYITTNAERFTLLYNLITKRNLERVLVFANRRDEARRLKDKLAAHGISCALLSGDVEQEQRIKRLEAFRNGRIRVLVATDVAARGIHVEAISHVVNYNLPDNPEDYVHRIGRTGRAGATGTSVSFATEQDAYEIPSIEEFLGTALKAIYPPDEFLVPPPPPQALPPPAPGQHGGPHRRRRRRPHR